MARISGVDLPEGKRIEIALTYIYGIGRSRSGSILDEVGVDKDKTTGELSEEEVREIRNKIQEEGMVEGELRKKERADIARLVEIGCYRGIRHKKGLPVRGQRTRTNARTRKGPRKKVK